MYRMMIWRIRDGDGDGCCNSEGKCWKDAICDVSRLAIVTYDSFQILYGMRIQEKAVQDAEREKIKSSFLLSFGFWGWKWHY